MPAEKVLLTKVLLLADKAETARCWADALKNSADVWSSSQDVPGGVEIEVIFTNLPDAKLAAIRAATTETESSKHSGSTWGVIGMSTAEWADVSLPADTTPRELRLACSLLSKIARLRAERDRAARAGRESRRLADTDPLTGLPNRRVWDAHLAMHRPSTESAPVCVAIVDLDSFKQINDRGGLAEGDRVLKRAAESLAGCLRHDDLIARLGGDEFGVLLKGVDEATARKVLDRLRAAVPDSSMLDGVAPLTASIGFALDNEGSLDLGELLAIAERGMRQAKRAGGDRICLGSRDRE